MFEGAILFSHIIRQLYACKGSRLFAVLSLTGYTSALLLPFVNGLDLNYISSNNDFYNIVCFAFFISLLNISVSLLVYLSNRLALRITAETRYRVLAGYLDGVMRSPISLFEKCDSGYLASRLLADTDVVCSFVVSSHLSIIYNLSILVIFVFLLSPAGPVILVLSAVLTCGYALIIFRSYRPLYSISQMKQESESNFFSEIARQLSRAEYIQVESSYTQVGLRIEKSFSRVLPFIVQLGRVNASFSSSGAVVGSVLQGFILIYAGLSVSSGRMTIGEVVAINSYVLLLLQSVKGVVEFFKNYRSSLASYDRLEELVPCVSHSAIACVSDEIDSIKLNGLEYAFRTDKKEVVLFQGFSYEFCSSKTYSIVGDNGTGKTTLLKIIMGLYDSNDAVEYNGISINCVDFNTVRSREFSYCGQTVIPVGDFLGEWLDYENAIQGSSIRGNFDFSPLINGLIETPWKKCSELSGGEQRRIALWAALRKRSSVLVLDEPSVGLDDDARSFLSNYISNNQFNQIMIIVSHDDRIINSTDYVVRIP